jgi:hypothetical protein
MTSDEGIPLVKLPALLNSTFDLYSADPSASVLPGIASVVPFAPELDAFLADA